FFGINQGPGLFSTLRSIIATINALHFSTRIPIIGVDGLTATALEFNNSTYPFTVTLLNAYNNDVHYAICQNKQTISMGYQNISTFLKTLLNKSSTAKFYFIGNAVSIYQDCIKSKYGSRAIIPIPIPQLCSINTIASLALKKFIHITQEQTYLFPL